MWCCTWCEGTGSCLEGLTTLGNRSRSLAYSCVDPAAPHVDAEEDGGEGDGVEEDGGEGDGVEDDGVEDDVVEEDGGEE